MTCVVAGSSPRVRGTPWSRGIACTPNRFIPACAGNSPAHPGSSRGLPVHPRACGELVIVRDEPQTEDGSSPRVRGQLADIAIDMVDITGSSPRVRGTLRDRRFRRGWFRFIPARAGNSMADDGTERAGRGSSPRVRGTPPRPRRQSTRRRFIPARAGNSATPASPVDPGPVHPRACGELTGVTTITGPGSGSSPRVRGTLL